MEPTYHCTFDGQTFGPYSVAEIQAYRQSGQLSPFTSVWDPQSNQWIPINKFLASQANVPVPQAPSAQPNPGGSTAEPGKEAKTPAPFKPSAHILRATLLPPIIAFGIWFIILKLSKTTLTHQTSSVIVAIPLAICCIVTTLHTAAAIRNAEPGHNQTKYNGGFLIALFITQTLTILAFFYISHNHRYPLGEGFGTTSMIWGLGALALVITGVCLMLMPKPTHSGSAPEMKSFSLEKTPDDQASMPIWQRVLAAIIGMILVPLFMRGCSGN